MSDATRLYVEIAELTLLSLDGALDDAGFDRLHALLSEDPAAREIYRDVVMSCSSLSNASSSGFDAQTLCSSLVLAQALAPPNQDGGSLIQQLADLAPREDEAAPVDLTDELERRMRASHCAAEPTVESPSDDTPLQPRLVVIPKPVFYGLLAACLLLAAWGVSSLMLPGNAGRAPSVAIEDAPQPAPEAPPHVVPVPQPQSLGTFSRLFGTQWASGELAVGDAITPGRLDLVAGYAEVTLSRGAVMIVEAPATFEVLDDNTVYLHQGIVVANVPVSAHGFTVNTDTASVVDLGTQFAVDTTTGLTTTTSVLTGAVRLHGKSAEGTLSDSVLLRRNVTAATNADGKISLLPPTNRVRHASDWNSIIRGWMLDGDIRVLEDRPASLAPGAVEHNLLTLIPERRDVILDRPLEVVWPLGDLFKLEAPRVLPEQTRVDTYTIHFDTPGEDLQVLISANAEIRFSKPILGVILDRDAYLASTSHLGVQGLAQVPESQHYLLGIEPLQDFVEIMPDGKTLRLSLGCTNGVDQIRVLTQATPLAP